MDKETKELRLAQWAGIISEQKKRGLTVREWCEQSGITRDSYYYWQRKVRKEVYEELNLKRITSLVLSLALILGGMVVFTGCGGNQTNKEQDTLKEIINLNIKYLLNDFWYEERPYSYWPSSGIGNAVELTDDQNEDMQWSAASFANWRDEEYLYIANSTGGQRANENSIRPLSHTCYVVGTAIKYDIYDESVVGVTEADATLMISKLIKSLSRDHLSNTDGGWGDMWQSALWAENTALGAWMLWDELDDETIEYVQNMLLHESNRFNDYTVPYYMDSEGNIVYEGDTKGEENAWNSTALALALCMFPENKNVKIWMDKLEELLLSSSASPEDVHSDEVVDGYVLSDVLNGSNINEDGTVVNHGRYHIDYTATTIEGMLDTAFIFRAEGRDVPDAAYFNLDKMYGALVTLDLGKYDEENAGHHFYEHSEDGGVSSAVNMPGDNDWGGMWYPSYYLLDTAVQIRGLDTELPDGLKASDWAEIHLETIHEMVTRGEAKGNFFIEGENNFVSGETYMMHNLIKAYVLKYGE